MTPGELRRANLLAFITERHQGNKAEFSDFIKTKRPQVYRYFPQKGRGQEPGELFARKVEKAYGLPRGYFDRDLDSGAAPLLDRLSARMRDDPALRVLVQFILDDPETPLPEGVRDSLRPLLNGLKLAVSNAAFPETRTAGRPLPVPAAFRNT